jgi:hypothetical protein
MILGLTLGRVLEFCFLQNVQTGSGAKGTSYSIGGMDSFPGHKGLQSEANHSPPSTTNVKNEWRYMSTPPVHLRIEERDNFKIFHLLQRSMF